MGWDEGEDGSEHWNVEGAWGGLVQTTLYLPFRLEIWSSATVTPSSAGWYAGQTAEPV